MCLVRNTYDDMMLYGLGVCLQVLGLDFRIMGERRANGDDDGKEDDDAASKFRQKPKCDVVFSFWGAGVVG